MNPAMQIRKLRPIHYLPLSLAITINIGIYYDYEFHNRTMIDRSTWLLNHSTSLYSFALSGGSLNSLLLSSFSHVHPLHLLVNTIGLTYSGLLVLQLAPWGPLTFTTLVIASGIGGSTYFLKDQWERTIKLIKKENPFLWQNVMEAIIDYRNTLLNFTDNKQNENMVIRSEANENILNNDPSLTTQQAAILAYKEHAAIEAFREAVMATPNVYSVLNSAGLGSSGIIMGLLTYSSLRLLLYGKPTLAIYMGLLMAFEVYAVAHPDDYDLTPPHRYTRRPGEEVSDMPELTQKTPELPIVDPHHHRHFVIGHAAHVGGGLTGIMIFLAGQTGSFIHTFYRTIVSKRSGGPSSSTPILRSSLLPWIKSNNHRLSIGIVILSSTLDKYYNRLGNNAE